MKGYENIQRDLRKALLAAMHRPVTIHLLRLLGHATNTYWEGDSFNRLSFWVVRLTAFWGSLRIDYLLLPRLRPVGHRCAEHVRHLLRMGDQGPKGQQAVRGRGGDMEHSPVPGD